MTANLLYALGTLAFWAGGALVLAALLLKNARPLRAGVGALALLFAATTPAFRGGFGIPLVWPALPFAGWGALLCVVFCATRLAQAGLQGSVRRGVAATIWAIAAVAFVSLYRLDPENRVELLRGRITLGSVGALALVALVVAALGAMIAIGRRGKRFATHAALLTGSLVFGLPFAWLLITSFKEDRDMASPNGLVWIPRVQRTVPYLDAEEPLLEGRYNGTTVQATLAGRSSDGSYLVEVQRPSSLRGVSFSARPGALRPIPKDAPVVQGDGFTGFVARELSDGRRLVRFLTPASLKDKERTFLSSDLEPVRDVGLRTQNYTEALEALPIETNRGLVYLKNTLILVV